MGMQLVELDRVIDDHMGEKIPEIVRQVRLESSEPGDPTAGGHHQKDNTVFDLGGGVIEREETCKLIAENCFVVWLKADPPPSSARIKGMPIPHRRA